ncbi:hypothetical protein, partial [Streptomyces sp. NPDC052012]|uniref:hypothetical protein n=1 Tax=Streptomyces sp. NPDC052012 TaxID=3155051 RepID=UPI00344FD790
RRQTSRSTARGPRSLRLTSHHLIDGQLEEAHWTPRIQWDWSTETSNPATSFSPAQTSQFLRAMST